MDNVTRVQFPHHDHDDLCPISHEDGIARENCTYCTLIEAARADERERAAQRVRVATGDPDPCVLMCGDCPVCDHWRTSWRAIAAARGEAS